MNLATSDDLAASKGDTEEVDGGCIDDEMNVYVDPANSVNGTGHETYMSAEKKDDEQDTHGIDDNAVFPSTQGSLQEVINYLNFPMLKPGIPMPISADPTVPDPASMHHTPADSPSPMDAEDEVTEVGPPHSSMAIASAIPASLPKSASGHRTISGLFTPMSEASSSPTSPATIASPAEVDETGLSQPATDATGKYQTPPTVNVDEDAPVKHIAKPAEVSSAIAAVRNGDVTKSNGDDFTEGSKTALGIPTNASDTQQIRAPDFEDEADADADGDLDPDYEMNGLSQSRAHPDAAASITREDSVPARVLSPSAELGVVVTSEDVEEPTESVVNRYVTIAHSEVVLDDIPPSVLCRMRWMALPLIQNH